MHEHGSRSVEIRNVGGERHNCCPPVTTAHWAELGSDINSNIHPLLAYLPAQSHPPLGSNYENLLRPVRGPPIS
jgi:hypothetical protein